MNALLLFNNQIGFKIYCWLGHDYLVSVFSFNFWWAHLSYEHCLNITLGLNEIFIIVTIATVLILNRKHKHFIVCWNSWPFANKDTHTHTQTNTHTGMQCTTNFSSICEKERNKWKQNEMKWIVNCNKFELLRCHGKNRYQTFSFIARINKIKRVKTKIRSAHTHTLHYTIKMNEKRKKESNNKKRRYKHKWKMQIGK